MENLDIIILTVIVSTLFAVFIGYTIKEFISIARNQKVQEEAGPRADLVKFVGKLFDSPVKNSKEMNQRLNLYNKVERTISDMESDGVYFPEEIKKELKRKRSELRCEYSGLPSVKSYDK